MVQRSKHSIDIIDLDLGNGTYLRQFEGVIAMLKYPSGIHNVEYPIWAIELADFEPALIDKCDGSEPEYLSYPDTDLLFRSSNVLQNYILRKVISL